MSMVDSFCLLKEHFVQAPCFAKHDLQVSESHFRTVSCMGEPDIEAGGGVKSVSTVHTDGDLSWTREIVDGHVDRAATCQACVRDATTAPIGFAALHSPHGFVHTLEAARAASFLDKDSQQSAAVFSAGQPASSETLVQTSGWQGEEQMHRPLSQTVVRKVGETTEGSPCIDASDSALLELFVDALEEDRSLHSSKAVRSRQRLSRPHCPPENKSQMLLADGSVSVARSDCLIGHATCLCRASKQTVL